MVNDGSKDNSENICLYYKKLYDDNIVYIKLRHSGVSRGRNVGLKYVKGLYVNFLDSDDKWDTYAFKSILLFYKYYKNVDLVTGRIKYFESLNTYHFLDYKFKKTRIVNLTEEYGYIQLSASSCFFRYSSIQNITFDEDVIFEEDAKFIGINLLAKPLMGIVKEAIYYYRKRADASSATQYIIQNQDFYFKCLKFVTQYLVDQSISLYNKIIPYIKYYIAYELLFRIYSKAYNFLDSVNYKLYCDNLENLLNQIEDKYILEQKIYPAWLQIFLLSKKYKKDLRYNMSINKVGFIYSNYVMINIKKPTQVLILRILEIRKNILHIEAQDKLWLPINNYYYYSKLDNKIFLAKYEYYSGYDLINMYGTIYKGRVIIFDIKLKKKYQQKLRFFIFYMGSEYEIFPFFGSFTRVTSIVNSYYVKENYIIKNNNNRLIIYPYSKKLEINLEEQYSSILNNLNMTDILKWRKEYIEYRHKSRKNKKNEIWLINDRKNLAGDNGEYFFRYLLERKPKGIDYYFVISNNCYDYVRLKKYGHILDLNSSEYLSMFLKADKIISSNSDIIFINPFGDDDKYIRDLYHFDLIYLQNGIIKDDISFYIHKIVKNFNLIITSSEKDYNSLLKYNYGYDKKSLVIAGLARFDNLKKIEKNIKNEKIITIYPTWRKYIKGTINLITKETITSEAFINTTFFQYYNKLINNYHLINIMKTYDYKGILCLHPNFAKQYQSFNKNKIFKVKKGCFKQELLQKSSLLITDYSSIFFDFGYIQKPVIYTQFDIEEYRKNHFPKADFDYEKHGFGPICYNMECTIKKIISLIENNCQLTRKYLNRIKNYFKYNDDKNCFRIYEAIIKGQHKNFIYQNYLEYIFIILIILKKLYI